MAEVVHKNLEAMLPQLEELESSGIFSHDEIRAIVKCRREHEYRLVRRPTRKEDFLAAIKYELRLDLLRKKRKKRLRITGTGHDADYGILNRINRLFSMAVRKFKGDLKLWLQYIEFAQGSKRKISLGQIYGKALALHPSCTSLWVMAAKFQIEDLNDSSSARSILQQGLRVNSSSQHLWLECFRMEMIYVMKLRKRRAVLGLEEGGVVPAPCSDEVLSYKLASVVFQQATKAIPEEVSFRLDFLPVCAVFAENQSIQQEIYDSVQKDFPLHPRTWDALARKHLLQSEFSSLSESQVLEVEETSAETFAKGVASIKDSLGEKGCGKVLSDIWDLYLAWCVERLEDERSCDALRKKVQARIKTVFRQPSREGHFAVSTYLQYMEVLESMKAVKELEEVGVASLRAYPSSLQLWLVRLGRLKCSSSGRGAKTKMAALEKAFKEALKNVPVKDSLPIWELWISKVTSAACPASLNATIEDIFQAGLVCGDAGVRGALLCHYLDWAVGTGGISAARTLYTRVLANPPVPLEVYQKCIDLEKGSSGCVLTMDVPRLRDIYERAIREHGSCSHGLWLDYICLELSCETGSVEKVGKLYWRATKELRSELVSTFIELYSNLQTIS